MMSVSVIAYGNDMKGQASNQSVISDVSPLTFVVGNGSKHRPPTSDVSPLTFVVGTGGKHRPPMISHEEQWWLKYFR
jgi:hypothetical protein